MKWNKLIGSICVFLFLTNGLSAQNDRPFRIELQSPEEMYPYDVINLHEKGLIVFFENENISKSLVNWRFVYYDVFFRKQWSTDVPMPRYMEPKLTFADSTRFSILFKYEGKRNMPEIHKYVSISLQDSVRKVFDLPVDKRSTPRKLYSFSDRAFFSYSDDKSETFYMLKYAEGVAQTIKFPSVENGSIQFLSTIPNSTQILVGVRNDISRKNNELIIFRMSIDGLIVSSSQLPFNDDAFINQAKIIPINNDTLMILGTYVLKNRIQGNFFSPSTEVNTGVFTALYNYQQLDTAKYFNFSQNAMIFRYLSSKEQDKMRKKVESERSVGESVSLDLQLLVHEPVLKDSTIFFLVEAFSPEYRTDESMSFDFYGRPMPNNRTYFEGYRYTNAIVSGFDFNGSQLWDHNYSLNEMISFDLIPRVSLSSDSNVTLLAYSYDGNINTFAFNGYNVVQNPERSRIEPLHSSDFVIRTEKSQLEHWYKNFFLSYGYQKIRSSGKGNKNRDNAFFLNKMVY